MGFRVKASQLKLSGLLHYHHAAAGHKIMLRVQLFVIQHDCAHVLKYQYFASNNIEVWIFGVFQIAIFVTMLWKQKHFPLCQRFDNIVNARHNQIRFSTTHKSLLYEPHKGIITEPFIIMLFSVSGCEAKKNWLKTKLVSCQYDKHLRESKSSPQKSW